MRSLDKYEIVFTATQESICGRALNLLFAKVKCVSRSPKFSATRAIEAADRHVLELPVSD